MAIQVRRGANADFDASKMLPGEFAVTTDGSRKAYVAFKANDVKEISFKNDINITAENIKNALGYTPADEKDINKLNEKLVQETGKLSGEIDDLKNYENTENVFQNWKNGTWNRNNVSPYTPQFVIRKDRLSFEELLFVESGTSMKMEAFSGQKYAIARWTKNGDVWTNIEYSNWFTESQILNISVDSYISICCAMADGSSDITPSNLGIIVTVIDKKPKIFEEIENVKKDIETIFNKPKSIFDAEIADTIAKVEALQTEPCLVFPKITDIHYDPSSVVYQNFDETIKILKQIVKGVNCDFVANLGDNINGSSNQETIITDARYMLNAFKNIGVPYFFALGNHDTNYDPSPKLSIEQIYGAFYSATPKNVTINKNSNGTDFYIDYNDLGIRMVFINSNYLNSCFIADASSNWFRDIALNTNHIVVLCAHVSPINTQNWGAKPVYNGDYLKNKINEFIENGGTLIQLFGHSHADFNFTSPWLSIASTCGKFEKANLDTDNYRAIVGYDGEIIAPSRTIGEVTEQAFDIVVIRPTSRKINLIRFGAGDDREFTF